MSLVQSIAAACLVVANLGVVGAAVAAGCCSTSKFGFYALSSSIYCTIVCLLEAGQGFPLPV